MTLGVVEVGGDGNDGFGDFFAEESFGVGFDFAEDHGADFFWGVIFVAHFDGYAVAFFDNLVGHDVDVMLDLYIVEFAADEAFDAVDGVFGIGNSLALGDFAH